MCKMETWLLEDFVEGLLGVAETAILEAHLANCEDCKRELAHIKLLFWEMESMRRDPIPVPDTVKVIENTILNEWLTDKETWLQHAGLQLKNVMKNTTIPLLPKIPAVDRVTTQLVAATGTATKKTAKWVGKTTFRLIRQRINPSYKETASDNSKSSRTLETKLLNSLISSLTGGGR